MRKIPREILDKVEEDVQKTKFADLVDTKEILIFDNFSDKYNAVNNKWKTPPRCRIYYCRPFRLGLWE